ncbi:MAG: SMC-Scp complex subunit ScpB, partial [Acidobacteriota bacterium]
MGAKEDLSIIEAALYAADRPLTLGELREILGTSSETYARKLVEELIAEYGKRGGPLVLAETSKGTFSLRLREEYMPKLEGVVPKARLSRGALKTLAMIAYK